MSDPGLAMFGLFGTALIFAYCGWRIFSRVGLMAGLGAFMMILPLSPLLLIYLAFAQWPIEKQLKEKGGTLPSPYSGLGGGA